MSQNIAIQIYPEVLRTLAFGSISSTYAGVGTALKYPGRIYYLVNTTDVLLTFSWDGINDHFVVPAGSYILIDVTSNKTTNGGAFMVAENTRTYVKGSPSLGAVYLTSFFGNGTTY
jgi:hypothetical protein